MPLMDFQFDPLHHACIYGSLEDVKKLVKLGLPIDCVGQTGLTPLGLVALKLYAHGSKDLDPLVVQDYEDKIEFLLKNGADPLRRWYGLTITDIIFHGKNEKVIQSLECRLQERFSKCGIILEKLSI